MGWGGEVGGGHDMGGGGTKSSWGGLRLTLHASPHQMHMPHQSPPHTASKLARLPPSPSGLLSQQHYDGYATVMMALRDHSVHPPPMRGVPRLHACPLTISQASFYM